MKTVQSAFALGVPTSILLPKTLFGKLHGFLLRTLLSCKHWAGAAQASSRNQVLFYCLRVNLWLFPNDGWPTTVKLDELAPNCLLDSLIIELDNQTRFDLRLSSIGVLRSTARPKECLIHGNTILDKESVVGNRTRRQNTNPWVGTLVDLLHQGGIGCL